MAHRRSGCECRAILLIALAVLACPDDARSQTQTTAPGSHPFLSAGIGAAADSTWGDESPGPLIITASGGVNISKHLGIRLALDVPTWFSTESQSTIGPLRTHTTEKHRTVGWSVLIDGHGETMGRVQPRVLGGATFALHQSVFITSTDQLGAGNAVVGHTDSTNSAAYQWLGLTGGAEFPVTLNRHVQIVPMAAFTYFLQFGESSGSTIVRGGFEARWQF